MAEAVRDRPVMWSTQQGIDTLHLAPAIALSWGSKRGGRTEHRRAATRLLALCSDRHLCDWLGRLVFISIRGGNRTCLAL